MAFTGNLNSVALTDIVQLIGMAQKSGTLTVVTGRGRFTVLFSDGDVVDASACRFAQNAVGGGGTQRKEQYVRANLTGESSGGVGLEEMAGKIFRLRAGHFNFQAGDPQTDSRVRFDVSGLLLESFRRHDEATRGGAAAADEYEASFGDVIDAVDAKGHVTGLPAAPARLDPLRHLYQLTKALPDNPNRLDFVKPLLDAARQVFDRALLFRVAGEELQCVGGFTADGAGETDRLDAALASIRIPRGARSQLQDVVDARHMGLGEAEGEWWRTYMPAEFGPPPAAEYVAIPVSGGDSCLMVLYGDTFMHREFADPLRALEIICRHVGLMRENELLRGRSSDEQTPRRVRPFGLRPSRRRPVARHEANT